MRKVTFSCIDGHTCGNPVRLITSGHPNLKGKTMSEKRQHFMAEFDWIRQSLMFEPRGHDMMSGAFIYPPMTDDADASILFVETSGCLPMCGHGLIGTVTFALQKGLLNPKQPGFLKLDTPAGGVDAQYKLNNDEVEWVKLYNVPAYLAHEQVKVRVPELGELIVDVSFGGNFYIIVDPQLNFPGIEHWSAADILFHSPRVRDAVNNAIICVHPEDSTVQGASHVLWTGKPRKADSDGANAVFYGEKAIDRSPCGTGTSARMAQLYTRGLLTEQVPYVHESYIGSQFVGCIEGVTKIGDKVAIKPSIQGWSKVTGTSDIHVDERDPYAFGFQVV